MEKRLAGYKKTLQSDKNALNAFMKDPSGELEKHTGHVITIKQEEALKNFFAAGHHVSDSFSGIAPKWVHDLVDALWDAFMK